MKRYKKNRENEKRREITTLLILFFISISLKIVDTVFNYWLTLSDLILSVFTSFLTIANMSSWELVVAEFETEDWWLVNIITFCQP